MRYCLFFVLLAVSFTGLSQPSKIDSLKSALKTATHDSIRDMIATEFFFTGVGFARADKLNDAMDAYLQSAAIFESTKNKEGMAAVYNSIAQTHRDFGDDQKAMDMFLKSLKLIRELKDTEGEASTIAQIGLVHFKKGDILTALEYMEKSLMMYEQMKNDAGISESLCNIAVIHQNQKDTEKALEYYLRAVPIDSALGNKEGLSTLYNNIGSVYRDRNEADKAMAYFRKSLAIQQDINDLDGMATSYNNIGIAFRMKDQNAEALQSFKKGLSYALESGHQVTLGHCYLALGEIYSRLEQNAEAESHLKKAYAMAADLRYPLLIRETNNKLYQYYKKLNKTDQALKHYETYILMRDSIYNEDTRRASIRSQFKYEYSRKAAADSVKAADEKKITDARLAEGEARLKQERTQRLALYGGLALVALFSIFMYNRFRITQKQKRIIEQKEKETQSQNIIITQQKHLVEEKHKEITDSINYAERIQRSFLATKDMLDKNLNNGPHGNPNYFVMFKPKDVVSGDFYWASELRASHGDAFLLATADSTGHGVPGAIMSLLNITSLEKATEHHAEPGDILNATRKTIIERLKKDGSAEGGKDGMDCSLLSFDFKNKTLKIAAANNPVWIVRHNHDTSAQAAQTKELIEIKPDKMPVGKHDKDQLAFTTHTLPLQEGDVIYTLTDGFPDQFGGEHGKKFMSKKLRELLAAHAHLPMPEQKQLLETTFKTWVGDLEQVDDVCLIGVRV